MNFPRTTLVALILTTTAACNPTSNQQAPTVVDTAAEAARIMAIEAEWSDMYGAGDLEGISGLLTQDTVLIAPGQPPFVGYDDVRAATQAMLAEGSEGVSWRSLAAFVAPSGEMAYDYGTASTVMPDGTVQEGSYVVVWVREGDQWKVAIDMFN